MKASSIIRSPRQLAISLRTHRQRTHADSARPTNRSRPSLDQPIRTRKNRKRQPQPNPCIMQRPRGHFYRVIRSALHTGHSPVPISACISRKQSEYVRRNIRCIEPNQYTKHGKTGQADCGTSDLVTIIPRAAQTISASTEIHIFAASATISRHIA